jgi:serine protease Do
MRMCSGIGRAANAAFGMALTVSFSATVLQAQTGPVEIQTATVSVADSLAAEVRSVFEKCRRAVVKIEATDQLGHLSGTGFFIDPAGTLYTSYTIGGETTDIVVRHGERKLPARRVFADPRSGIAVLKIDAETPFIAIGESQSVAIGSGVVAVGYPMDLPLSPSFGCVCGFDIKFGDRFFAARHIRANVPVQRGQGGAPMLNMRGEAVAILIASLDQGSACFGLPIEAAEKVRKNFLRHGEVRPGFVGVEVGSATVPGSDSNAEVTMVAKGAPAEKAGLQVGDRLLQIGSHKISAPEDVRNAAFFIAAEDEVKLKVARGDETVVLTLIATDQPDNSRRTAGEIPLVVPIGDSDLRGPRPEQER